MSRWLQIAEQARWRTRARDIRDNRDNSPIPVPNVPSVPSVRASEMSADKAGSPTKQFDGQIRHHMEPGPGATDDAWRNWRGHLLQQYRRHGDRATGVVEGELMLRWHQLYGRPSVEGQCAGCGGALRRFPTLELPGGVMVHYKKTNLNCLLAYGDKWQGAAAAGLVHVGIVLSADDEAE